MGPNSLMVVYVDPLYTSPLIPPIVVPYIIPYITPFKELTLNPKPLNPKP